jgi:hypothetical protein
MTAASRKSQAEDTTDEDRREAQADDVAQEAPAVEAPDGALVVDVMANLTLEGGEVLEVNQKGVTVPDTAEVRACITNGYLRLSD